MSNEIKLHPRTGRPINPAPMHDVLTGFDKYNTELPVYVNSPFSEDQVLRLRSEIERHKNRTPEYFSLPGDQEEYRGDHKFDPKIVHHMSRCLIEFDCPSDIEETMDSYAKPLYKESIRLTHYQYIEYNLKYGNGKDVPSLPPHLDSDENLVTFNYQLGGNIDDWLVYIDDKPYELKNGDAIIFSAVNQVHWRPKRKWSKDESLEIVSFDYSPPTNYRWTGQDNPIDPEIFPDKRLEYGKALYQRPEFQSAWNIYHTMGLEIGISREEYGAIL
jgi:hypothetical protein